MWLTQLRADRAIARGFRPIGATALYALLLAGPALADEFHLASGKVVTGALVSDTGDQYILQTEMGRLQVKKSDVMRTVEHGTTVAEVEGDIAAAKKDRATAQTRYEQARRQATDGSPAAARLDEKLATVAASVRQADASAFQQQFQQARGLIDVGEYAAADTILRRLRNQTSTDDPARSELNRMIANLHFAKGIAALDTARLDTARHELEQAISVDPTFYPAYLRLGESLFNNSGTVRHGVDLFRQGLDIAGDKLPEQQLYDYQYKLAGKYFELGDYAAAAEMYAEVIPAREKYSRFADAIDRTAESYIRMGEENMGDNFEDTVKNLNEALRLDPSNKKALFLLGRIYLDRGQLENSITMFNRLVALDPRYEEANHYLGRAYLQIHQYEQALTYLGRELELRPADYQTLLDRAETHIALKNYTAAETDLEAARAAQPNRYMTYYLTGLIRFHQNNYEAAQAALLEALDKRNTAIPIHLLMGQVLVKQNQSDVARQWFEQVVNNLKDIDGLDFRHQSYLAEALTHLGDIALAENSPRQAQNYFTQARDAQPRYAPALTGLARANILLARDGGGAQSRDQLYREARALYEAAIAEEPENPEHYLALGTFFHRNQVDFTLAAQYFNSYVDKGGRDARVNGWLREVGAPQREELAPPPAASTAGAIGATTATVGVTTGTVTATTGSATLAGGEATTGTLTADQVTTGAIESGVPPAEADSATTVVQESVME